MIETATSNELPSWRKLCPHCGKEIKAKADICKYCHGDVRALPAPGTHDGTKVCPFCAEEVKWEAKVCKHCGRELGPLLHTSHTQGAASSQSSTRTWGILSAVIGAFALFSALAMDTSVSVGSGRRVHNIGLMNQQQNWIMVGCVLFALGLILIVVSRKR